MQLKDLLQSLPAHLEELERLQASMTQSYQRHKLIFGSLNVDDLFLHKQAFAQALITSIKQQTFSFQPLQQSSISYRGKRRQIYPHFISDHVIQRLIQRYLYAKINPILSDHLFSYRRGRSDAQARHLISQTIRQQTQHNKIDLYVAQTDLSNYTDTIPILNTAPLWQYLAPYREDEYTWNLIVSALRATYSKQDHLYCKLAGIPMGSPITPLIANLYLNELDHQLDHLTETLYIRFGDDIVIASTNAECTLHHMNTVIDHCNKLGLIINPHKTKYTYLTRAGRSSPLPPYIGNSKIDYLGHSIFANGEIFLKPNKEKALLTEIRHKIHTTGSLLTNNSPTERGHILCEMLNNTILNNSMIDTNYYLDTISDINHRSLLRRLDYMIALEVAKYLSRTKSVKAFRQIPYRVIRHQFGLVSLCQIKNEMNHGGKY